MNFESAASSPYASRPGSPGRRGSGFGAPGGIHSGRASGVSSPASVISNIAAPSHGLRHSSSSGSLGGFAGLSMTGINPHHAQSSPRSGGVAIGQHPAASSASAGQPFPMGFSPMAQYSALGAAMPQQNQFMPQQQHQHVQGMPQPQIPQNSGADSSNPALAYANAQLSYYALAAQRSPSNPALGGFSVAGPGIQGAPPNLNPHALSSALSDYSNSLPGSAASSPGAAPRRLPTSGAATGASTPGGLNAHQGNNSRFAASAVTGKRLNWSEMICQTIAESDQGKLVIQDLFEQMCTKFPEIREWAFGKDWEARVKNRIKSTLSIKGNLFVKVPRPSSAAGKGSWWTLSAEAQEAWKTGRVASVVKGNTGHTRSSSSKSIDGHALAMSSTANSRTASRAPSRGSSRRGSPVSSRGPSSQHAQRESQHALGLPTITLALSTVYSRRIHTPAL
ncbi:Transcription factor of the Forkhead/HNF3 family [Ceraceosorus bombacis]|uniref:Transcription factor of the Forkhead/HNF3 family n=1 Tax=Ceraceosorus bombacis TaxID=401625 RepID=A0A0P1BBV7_9BASI|nr:Transcription factor of the Forkhead/HNF3 family [Ceraceosorus bombacis]